MQQCSSHIQAHLASPGLTWPQSGFAVQIQSRAGVTCGSNLASSVRCSGVVSRPCLALKLASVVTKAVCTVHAALH